MRLQPGAHVGPYLVLEKIGSGGMGDVYRARDTRLNRLVALKVIWAGRRDEREESRIRFAAEARAIAALSHPHICALYNTGFEATSRTHPAELRSTSGRFRQEMRWSR